MDRTVLDVIEREIDDEVRTRFPGAPVRQVVLLQHGDDPQIEPRDLWARVQLREHVLAVGRLKHEFSA